jgi:thymidylate kinase
MNGLIVLLLISVALVISILVFFDFDKKLEKRENNAIGKLIVIEGIEGSGKSQLIALMKQHMCHQWAYTKEPYYTDDTAADWTKENYQMDRENHVQNKILPLLHQNKVLITNRYWTSGCVYDGWVPEAYLSIWPDPDLIIWLDREPNEEIAQKVKLPLALLHELRKGYAELFSKLIHEHHVPIVQITVTGKTDQEVLKLVAAEVSKLVPVDGIVEEHDQVGELKAA